MGDIPHGDSDEWARRAAIIGPQIQHAFPALLLSHDCLESIISSALQPLVPQGGLLHKAHAWMCPEAWTDSELLDFLNYLRDHQWDTIDWNRKWTTIPILPVDIFMYCLPGVLYWIVTDTNAAYEAIESLIEFSFHQHDRTQAIRNTLSAEQKQIIESVICLIRDFGVVDKPELQRAANEAIARIRNSR